MPIWPESPDDHVDPAIAPLIEAGEGESEGFDVAEADLIRHAEHGDQHGTDPIWRDAAGFRAEEIPGLDDDRYGGGDEEDPEPGPRHPVSRSWRRGRPRRDPSVETDLDVIPLGDRGSRVCIEFVACHEAAVRCARDPPPAERGRAARHRSFAHRRGAALARP